MRPIRFRAFCKEHHVMVFWALNDTQDFWYGLDHTGDEFSDEMESTGLKDGKDKEMYEGDILSTRWGKGDVKFGMYGNGMDHDMNDSGYGWYVDGKNIHAMGLLNHKDSEIVGDIYSNPELLKGKE